MGSEYGQIPFADDIKVLIDQLDESLGTLQKILWQNTPVYHYLHKLEFEIVLQADKGTSEFNYESNGLLHLRGADGSSKAWARAFFSNYAYDLTNKTKLGVLWYNVGSVGTGNKSRVHICTGPVTDPTTIAVITEQTNFGSFESPTWSVGDISAYSGEYTIMVEAYDSYSGSSVLSDLYVFLVILWNETEV